MIMELPPGASDAYGNVFSPSAPFDATGDLTVVADPGLADSFRLAPGSPLIDAATTDSWQDWVDFDGNPVPCGDAPDVGAIEYCPQCTESEIRYTNRWSVFRVEQPALGRGSRRVGEELLESSSQLRDHAPDVRH